jgi:hypothetical protein
MVPLHIRPDENACFAFSKSLVSYLHGANAEFI